MSFEDDYMDVLQNIEFSIVSVYREMPSLLDYDVSKALNTLWAEYRAERSEKTAAPAQLNERAELVYNRVKSMCEWRLGRIELTTEDGEPGPGPAPMTPDEIMACLKRILKSVELWNKRSGRQGYLFFIEQHIQ